MLRFLIGTGLLLMVVGFGAAGWQYWQGLPASPDALAADPAATGQAPVGSDAAEQGWLISDTGGLVAGADRRAYLVQDRLVPDRMVTMTLTASLASLLADGEALPAEPFLPVFADIRAPQIARSLCPVLTEGIAAACAVQSARVVPDSVDPALGTARFRVELAYRLKPSGAELPGPSDHVLGIARLTPDLPAAAADDAAPAAPAAPPASAEAALSAALAAATAACSEPDRALGCRLIRLSLDWGPSTPLSYQADIGWLSPLPGGVIPVAPIPAQPEG